MFKGVVPVTASLRDEATPTPASSTTSESPPTLRRAPFEADDALDADREDEHDDDESSNQGDNAFAWPTHNSYDEQRLEMFIFRPMYVPSWSSKNYVDLFHYVITYPRTSHDEKSLTYP